MFRGEICVSTLCFKTTYDYTTNKGTPKLHTLSYVGGLGVA